MTINGRLHPGKTASARAVGKRERHGRPDVRDEAE